MIYIENVIKKEYFDKIITLNDVNYIELQSFNDVLSELTIYYTLLGVITKKLGRIDITQSEIKKIVDNEFEDFNILINEDKIIMKNR